MRVEAGVWEWARVAESVPPLSVGAACGEDADQVRSTMDSDNVLIDAQQGLQRSRNRRLGEP
jgi:hypothetical protein